MKKTKETIILIDCGMENIQKFARAVRSRHFYTMVMPRTVPPARVLEENPSGIIFCTGSLRNTSAESLRQLLALPLPKLAINAAPDQFPGIDQINAVPGDPDGLDAVCRFCSDTCGCSGTWTMENFITDAVTAIREQVGDKTVVLGLSGGVDSSVAAALIHKAVGDNLTCVFVNHGLLRKNEPENVREIFEKNFRIKLLYIDASDRFLDKLQGVSDPERKRKIIGKEFIEVFNEAALQTHAPFLGQGTIYPDILESIPFDGNPNGVIKSHHNVGGLPEHMTFQLVEPLERLFKDEVRQVGRLLGLPASLLDRHPFPGPGLGVRHSGAITRETLEILRNADAIVTEELIRSGWYEKTWQTFAIFVPVRTVGMKDGKRTCDYVIAIRSVNTLDAVTAEVVELPWDLLFRMSGRIIREVPGVNRVVYDITAKPPGTIEWE